MSPRHRDPIPMPEEDDELELDISRDNREIEPDAGEASGKHGVGAVVLHHVVTAVLVTVVLVTGLWSYYQFRKTSFFTVTTEAERSAFEVYAVDAQRDRITFALEVYQRLFDEYPTTLESLVDEGLLQDSDLFYPVGERRFTYQRLGQTYQLDWTAPEGPGPDGEVVDTKIEPMADGKTDSSESVDGAADEEAQDANTKSKQKKPPRNSP